MGTKTIGLREEVYERLRARKREDESFTDLIERLLDDASADWRETFGRLDQADADELLAITRDSRSLTGRGHLDRQRDAIEAFADRAIGEGAPDHEGPDGA